MKKSVFITGASQGIGEATLYEFARAGWDVRFSYYKNRKDALRVAQKCSELGSADVGFVQLDITSDSSIKKCVRKIGKVDVLINNAGFLSYKKFEKQTFKDIELECRTNLEGLMKLTLVFLPYVRKQVVNVSSRAGQIAHAGLVSYCGTKFGVRGFTQAIADEVKRLKFICVNPGLTSTSMTDFEGVAPSKVGEIIFRAVVGKVRVRSGGDVNIWKMVPGKKTRDG